MIGHKICFDGERWLIILSAGALLGYAKQPLIAADYQTHWFHTTLLSLSAFHGWNTVGKAIKPQVIHSSLSHGTLCYLVIPYAVLQYFIWLLITAVQIRLITCMQILWQ